MPFLSTLDVRFGRDKVMLIAPLAYRDRHGQVWEVHAGFWSDLASFPRPLRFIWSKLGPHAPAAVLHDALYAARTYSRKFADQLFREAMVDSGMSLLEARVIWLGVRLGGCIPWAFNVPWQSQTFSTTERAMNISEQGVLQAKEAEGYHERLPDGRCKSYQCIAGKWTIGWGCTDRVTPGMVWTEEQADEALRAELAKYGGAVLRLVKVPLTQARFDALTLFVLNVGIAGFEGSTLLQLLNKGDYAAVPTQLLRWTWYTDRNTGEKKQAPGLHNRRLREISMWEGAHLDTSESASRPPPQSAEVGYTSPWPSLLRSGTVLGAIISFFGWLLNLFEGAVRAVSEAGLELANLHSIREMGLAAGLSVKGIGYAMAAAGLVVVLQRRFLAAQQGKRG